MDRMLIADERHLQLVLGEQPIITAPIDRTGRCARTRPPNARIRLPKAQVSRSCARTGWAA
jgi:hypothetical protein